MKSNLIYFVMALITGALIPIQASTNAAFSKSIGNPYITGLLVFIVGLFALNLFICIYFKGIGDFVSLSSKSYFFKLTKREI